METACDSAVTARLNCTERREYAMTLLALFSQPCRANSVLGMALSSAEKDAERRVRGVFGAHRSKVPVKILAALLSARAFGVLLHHRLPAHAGEGDCGC